MILLLLLVRSRKRFLRLFSSRPSAIFGCLSPHAVVVKGFLRDHGAKWPRKPNRHASSILPRIPGALGFCPRESLHIQQLLQLLPFLFKSLSIITITSAPFAKYKRAFYCRNMLNLAEAAEFSAGIDVDTLICVIISW